MSIKLNGFKKSISANEAAKLLINAKLQELGSWESINVLNLSKITEREKLAINEQLEKRYQSVVRLLGLNKVVEKAKRIEKNKKFG